MPRHQKLFTSASLACLLGISCPTAWAQAPGRVPVPGAVVRALSPEDNYEGSDSAEAEATDDYADSDTDYGDDQRQTEIIRERYPNGNIKIERNITEDAAGNLVNHGRWTQWDQAGNVIGTGDFRMGKQHGRWVRYLGKNEGKMFSAAPYQQFERPFISEATFEEGKLQGTWYVIDARKRRIMQCEFEGDKPHGIATWWYASGQKMREVTYRNGKIDGELMEWNQSNQLVSADNYKEGRKHTVKVEWYAPGKKKAEGPYLMARQITEETYDWWTASVTSKSIGKEGVDQRHGNWTWWYPNGMKKMEGAYEENQPHGKFVWWYPNSQKYIEGSYSKGKQEGNWIWWHPNGLTQFKGEYIAGAQHGRWTGYDEAGKLIEVQDFTAGQGAYDAAASDSNNDDAAPQRIDLGSDEPSVKQPRLQAILPNASGKSARRGQLR